MSEHSPLGGSGASPVTSWIQMRVKSCRHWLCYDLQVLSQLSNDSKQSKVRWLSKWDWSPNSHESDVRSSSSSAVWGATSDSGPSGERYVDIGQGSAPAQIRLA